jgi:hypothetical protein
MDTKKICVMLGMNYVLKKVNQARFKTQHDRESLHVCLKIKEVSCFDLSQLLHLHSNS